MRPIITLTTDFGLRDPYVAEMKAVILSICPEANIVDISHEIEKFNIREAAFVLACAAPYFPKGTIHVAVVDPGVGTKRKPLLIQTRNATYIGPNNGILTLAIKNDKPMQIREITNKKLMMPQISNTFHGRDVFAPTAAHIANNTRTEIVGRRTNKITKPSFADVVRNRDTLIGEVIHIDNFGNAITNISGADLRSWKINNVAKVKVGKRKFELKLCKTYGDTKNHQLLITVDSHGLLEISVNQGSATRDYDIENRDKVTIYRSLGKRMERGGVLRSINRRSSY